MKPWEAPRFDCKKPGCGAVDSSRCTEPLSSLGEVKDLEKSLQVGCRVAHYTKMRVEDQVSES
jgi:hypothetical protein